MIMFLNFVSLKQVWIHLKPLFSAGNHIIVKVLDAPPLCYPHYLVEWLP